MGDVQGRVGLELNDLRHAVSRAAGVPIEQVTGDADLIALGLDSIRLMRLAGWLRKQGLPIRFADLSNRQTVDQWWELVRDVRGAATADANTPAVAPDSGDPFDLAVMQHAFWVGRVEGQELSGVSAHFYNEFDADDDSVPAVVPDRLERAVRALFRRHDMLRVRITEGGQQRIDPEPAWDGLRVHDLRGLGEAEAQERLMEIRRGLSHQSMDVASGHVFDVQLSLLDGNASRMHVSLDMMAADAMSLRTLLADLASAYGRETSELPDLHYSYRRYLAERDRVRKDAREASAAWWRAQAEDLPRAPALPVVQEAPGGEGPTVTRRHRWLSPQQKSVLSRRSHRHGLTSASVLATAFAEVIARWSASDRFLLNIPAFDREPLHEDVDAVVGDFSSSVLLDADMSGALPFAERAAEQQSRLREALGHTEYTGVEVLRDLTRAAGGEAVLAPVVFTSALELGELFAPEVQKSFGRPSWIISQGPQVWLDAQVTELDGGILVNWDARDSVFPPDLLDAMFDAYTDLIARLLEDDSAWDVPVSIPLPTAQRLVRERANATEGDSHPELLHERFFRMAEASPDLEAVVWDCEGARGSWTYGELSTRARRVASLLASQGIGPGDRVGITLPKGPDQIVAVLGVLAAGAAYVPSGVDVPMRRRARVLESASVRIVITDGDLIGDSWPPSMTALPITAALDRTPVPHIRETDRESEMYVLFTSGSTGVPKGVRVPHRAAANTIDAVRRVFDVNGSDRTIALSALDFDLSVYDMFAFLAFGGSIVALQEPQRRDAAAWARLISTYGVTVVSCVPALLDMLLTAGTDSLPDSSLRLVMLGGDWVTIDLPDRLRALVPGCRFAALGGMTEAAIHSTVFEVDQVDPDWRAVPYGTPLTNMKCRVVDQRGRDCPDWVPGELWVAGPGVALGYDRDAARTAERFVEHDGDRWYRSGDLARYWPDGTLEFLGRSDSQVKIRGHRIELGEIEAQLTAHPHVHRAVATVINAASRQLGAAVTLDAPTAADELHDWLKECLPGYMVPEHILSMEAFPITANGKIDRKAVLAELARASESPRAHEPPVGAIEEMLAGLWRDLLGVRDIGRHDGFFSLGGDSLLATRLMKRLRESNVAGAALSTLFTTPELADFASTLSLRTTPAAVQATVTAHPDRRFDPFPLTDVQRAYWIGRDPKLPLGGIGPSLYLELDGTDIDLPRLTDAWNHLVRRHDMLRAVITDDGMQRVLADVPDYRISLIETAGGRAFDNAVTDMRKDLAHGRLDATSWPLFEIRAVRRPASAERSAYRIGVVLDSIAFDGRSIMVLLTEWDALYRDPRAQLPPLRVTFRDCITQTPADAEQQRAALAYWRERVQDMPPAPALPLVTDPATVTAPRFHRYHGVVPPREWESFNDRARAQGLTPTAALLTAYAHVLAQWSGQDAATINLTLFDRDESHPDINNIVGDFSSLLLVECRTGDRTAFADSARRIQHRMWRDMDHRRVSGVRVLRELARQHGTTVESMPVVFTSVLGLGEDASLEFSSDFPQPVRGLTQTPQVWLDLKVSHTSRGLEIDWDSVDELFPEGMSESMFDAYVELVRRLAGGQWQQCVTSSIPERQHAIRARVNSTEGPVPESTSGGGLLHGGFFKRAETSPESPALIASGTELSYRDVADRALQVTAWLIDRGVEPGDTVAVDLPKEPAQIIALLGVLAAGATYLPIGTDLPAHRKTTLVTEGRAAVVIDDLTPAAAHEAAAGPIPVDTSQVAYVIFTSGTTGDPKGVEISHRSASNTLDDINTRFHVGPEDRVLAVSAAEFDLSVYDIFGVLGAGGALVLIAEDERRDAQRWLALAHEHRVSIWNTVPTLLEMLVTVAETAHGLPESLRLAMVSGDWVPLDLPARVRELAPGCRFVALGGATEASIWSNALDVTRVPDGWSSIPYGYPLRNQHFRVMDRDGRDSPDWIKGEIWIGGTGVAQGYRGDPARTAEKFVERDGERWYRTGDLGRYWPDGTLEFSGRADTQVKVRGHRIELGEIDAALAAHPDVERGVCVAPGDRQRRWLVAFVQGVHDTQALASFLAERLPAYAVPRQIVAVETLPLTSNGKVDRAALTELATTSPESGRASARRPSSASTRPTGPLEEKVARAWADLLGVSAVGRDDDFFALGGDSLLATRLVGLLRAEGVAGAELANLFLHPALAEFAATLSEGTADSAPMIAADPDNRYEPFPLTDVQQAYWVGRDPELPLGGVPAQFYIEYEYPGINSTDGDDGIDVQRLEEAWNLLIQRHEMLRAVVDADGRQRIIAETPRYEFTVIDAEGSFDERLAEQRERASLGTPDPATWPLFDIRMIHGGGRARLCAAFDNLIVDGLSILTLFDEWRCLYADPRVELPPVSIAFRDYVLQAGASSQRLARARDYWRDRLPSLPPAPRLPLRIDPADVGRPRFSRRETVVDAETWATITRRASRYGLTPAVVLLTCYGDVLSRWSGQRDLTVNLTLFDRRPVHPDIARTVGDFTSLLLAAYQPEPGDSWLDRARRTQEQLWRDLDHREVSGVAVLRDLAREQAVPVGSMPVVFTSMIGIGADLLTSQPWPDCTRTQTPQVWLDHQAVEHAGGVLLSWDSVDELFPDGLVDTMFAEYQEDIARLAARPWGSSTISIGAPRDTGTGTADPVVPSRGEPAGEPTYAPPRGEIEEILAGLWSELLGVDVIGRHDGFFALGGDSLLATRLIARLRAQGIAGAKLATLLSGPTLAEFASTVTPHGAVHRTRIVARPEQRFEPFPLTDVQEAYWIGRRGDFVLGGIPALFGTEREVDPADAGRLEDAWNRLIERHEMLRTIVTPEGQQRILPTVPHVDIPVIEVSPGDRGDEELERVREQMRHSTSDCTRWPLFDIRLLTRHGRSWLAVVFDTMIIDGASMLTLFTEWERLVKDPSAELEPLSLSFRDYITQSEADPERLAAAEQYWRDRIESLPPGPRLPLGAEPSEVTAPRFRRRQFRLDAPGWRTIRERARRQGLTPSVVLLGCYIETLAAQSRQTALTVNLTLFDRPPVHPDIDRVVGDFTSLILVAHELREDDTWLARMQRLQKQVWRDMDHREMSGVRVLREAAQRGGRLAEAVPVVFTSMLGIDDALDRRIRWPDHAWSQTPQVWLDHQAVELHDGVLLTWDFVEDLFPSGLIDDMFDSYVTSVQRLADVDWALNTPWTPAGSARSASPGAQKPDADPMTSSASESSSDSRPRPGADEDAGAPRTELEREIADMWRETIGRSPSDRLENFFALGGDSLAGTRLVQAAVNRFGVDLSLRQFFGSPTVAHLAAAIDRELSTNVSTSTGTI